MSKTFQITFRGGNGFQVNKLIEFVNRNNLSPTDYQLMSITQNFDLQTGYVLETNIVCVYFADNELR